MQQGVFAVTRVIFLFLRIYRALQQVLHGLKTKKIQLSKACSAPYQGHDKLT